MNNRVEMDLTSNTAAKPTSGLFRRRAHSSVIRRDTFPYISSNEPPLVRTAVDLGCRAPCALYGVLPIFYVSRTTRRSRVPERAYVDTGYVGGHRGNA